MRWRLLRFMSALLADGSVVALDVAAQAIWTPTRLEGELQHDAPLDIIQVHALHVVTDGPGTWLHSHGLAEMGFVDFDVLRPAEAIVGEQFDVLRAIAFAIVEGDAPGQIEPVIGAEPVALVDARAFMGSASASDRKLRDPEGHSERRVVCCDAEAHGVKNDRIDATLLNAPFDIAGLREGQHGEHPIELLSDWSLMTPLGQLTPRSLEVARRLRELRPELLKALSE